MYAKSSEVGPLRVFVSEKSIMKHVQLRGKVEAVKEECMLVGYAEDSKTWRVILCWDRKHKTC
jgi:hypothetical protein